MPTYEIEELNLSELSLVRRPANKGAVVTLFKCETESEDMTEKNEALEALKAQNEALRKALIDNGFVITAEGVSKKEITKAEDFIEVNGEKIAKSDLPEAVVKALEDAKVEKAAIELEKADTALTKKAETKLPHLELTKAKVLLKTAGEDKDFLEFLTAIDAMFALSMDEVGKGDKQGDMANANDTIEIKVQEIMTAKGYTEKMGYAKAYAEFASTKDGAALINKASKE